MPRRSNYTGEIKNRAEMAGLIGVSPTTLDRYVAAGCPVESRGATRREYRFNSAEVLHWKEKRDALARERTGGDASEAEIKRRHTLAITELKELQLAEKRGQMISVDDVGRVVADELANVRSKLLTIPGRVAVKLVGLSDEARIEKLIKDEVVDALSELTMGVA